MKKMLKSIMIFLDADFGSIIKGIAYLFLAYFIYLLSLITLQYIPIKDDVAFLNLKQEEIKLWYYKVSFFSHVFSSIIVLIAGAFQFSRTIRLYYISVHRISGKIYILLTLLVSCPTGLVMAYYANGGIIPQVSFLILGFFWFVFTLKAFLYIGKKDWKKHRFYMLRSYALALSAISLRLFKWVIASAFEWAPMDIYRLVSVLGWLFNLLIVEIYIKSLNSRRGNS